MRFALTICVLTAATACVARDEVVSATTETSDDPTDPTGTGTGTDTDVDTDTGSGETATTETETETDTDTDSETSDGPECGDGVLDDGEACDDGNTIDWDACSNTCTLPVCGDGLVQGDEACDLGPANGPGSLCNADCEPNVCGDGDVGPGEGCDDGNQVDDDACPNDCVLASCGNAILDPGEDCEDGNLEPGDGCTNACLFPVCGDGIVWVGHEECDDGNPVDVDACDNGCELTECGDGILQGQEQCDDGNLLANDGCNQCIEQRVVQISAGGAFTCALLDTGAVRCWGLGTYGSLGYGNTESIGDDELPWTAGDVDVGGAVTSIAVGDLHACALMQGGAVRCWGYNSSGQLGYGHEQTIGDNEVPADAGDVDIGGVVVQIAVGKSRTCALLESGGVRCWGSSGYDGLGYANTQDIGDNETPASVGDIDIGGPASQISASFHSCALLDAGGVRCWGESSFGQLGYGNWDTIGDDEFPAAAGDVDVGPGTVVQVSAGPWRTCAVFDDGALTCWGWGKVALGYYGVYPWEIGDDETPGSVGHVDLDEFVTTVAQGDDHTCVLLDDGAVRCWGYNGGGAVGTNVYSDFPAEMPDVELGDPAVALSTGDRSNCILAENGGVRCWGLGYSGALGYGNTSNVGDDEWPVTAGYVQVFQP